MSKQAGCLIIIIVLSIILHGCTTINVYETQAQRQHQRMQAQVKTAVQESLSCTQPILASNVAERIRQRFILDPDDADRIQKLADRGFANDSEIQDLLNFYAARRPCQKLFIEKLGSIYPSLVAVIAQGYTEADVDLAALLNNEITVGLFNKQSLDRITRIQREWQQAEQQAYSVLSQSHQEEIQQRQIATQNLQNWFFQQQLLLQQQNLINATNRPRSLNCRYVGNTMQCSSF